MKRRPYTYIIGLSTKTYITIGCPSLFLIEMRYGCRHTVEEGVMHRLLANWFTPF